MLLYKDNGRIYCDNFSFILPPNVLLDADQMGTVLLRDPDQRWTLSIILDRTLHAGKNLFEDYLKVGCYGHPEKLKEQITRFTTPGGVSGECFILRLRGLLKWDVRIRVRDKNGLEILWFSLSAFEKLISWEEFQKSEAMQTILDSLRIESEEACCP